MRIPFFIETIEGTKQAELQICRKVAAHLCKEGIAPLPFANNTEQLVGVLHTLKTRKQWPALFIVNTYWAEEVMRDLDAITGDTPILLFHRTLTPTYKASESADCMLGLQDADSRPLAVETYGVKTVDAVAERSFKNILCFLNDGELCHLKQIDARRRKDLHI